MICEHCGIILDEENSYAEYDDMCIDCIHGEFH